MKRVAVAVATLIGAAVGALWIIAGYSLMSNAPWHSRWPRWLAYATCPFIELGLTRLATMLIPLLNALTYGLLVYSILRFGRRAILAVIGGAVGVFWVIAIDAGMNGAAWPPHWRTWPAYITCPFIPLVGLGVLTVLVPFLNALFYGLLLYGLLKLQRHLPSAVRSLRAARR